MLSPPGGLTGIDGNKIEVQKSQLIRNQIVDAGHADKDEENKSLLKIPDQVILDSVQ